MAHCPGDRFQPVNNSVLDMAGWLWRNLYPHLAELLPIGLQRAMESGCFPCSERDFFWGSV